MADDFVMVELTRLRKEQAEPTDRTVGKVTVVSPLTIQFAGTEPADAVAGIEKHADYSPSVGDYVTLLRYGTAWVATGKYQ